MAAVESILHDTKPLVIREGEHTYFVAEAMLAYREAEAAMKDAERAVEAEKSKANIIVDNRQHAQLQCREIRDLAMDKAGSREGIGDIVEPLGVLQTAIGLYERAEQCQRAFPLGDAVLNYLRAKVVFHEAAVRAEKTRRAAREAEMLEDLAKVRTRGAPIKLNMADMLASYDQAVLRASNELSDAQSQLQRAENQILAQRRAFSERYQE